LQLVCDVCLCQRARPKSVKEAPGQ
jgi:hypothetical protein